MICFRSTQKQNQRRHYLHPLARLVQCQTTTLSFGLLVCAFLSDPLIQTNKSTFRQTSLVLGNNLFSPNRIVRRVLAVVRLRLTAFMQLSLLPTCWAGKVVKMWVKYRLWDRPFLGSKLRQQGSPTIFAGWRMPTISRITALHSRALDLAFVPADHFPLPEYNPLLRGTNDK